MIIYSLFARTTTTAYEIDKQRSLITEQYDRPRRFQRKSAKDKQETEPDFIRGDDLESSEAKAIFTEKAGKISDLKTVNRGSASLKI